MDNGFRSCDDPARLQRICNRLGPGAVQSFFWRWLHRLPCPFTRADLRAGYTYELAFRQFEFSDTRVFTRPAAGRAFFEGLIRDHLDVGRPDQVAAPAGWPAAARRACHQAREAAAARQGCRSLPTRPAAAG
jgi:hypothetical protein